MAVKMAVKMADFLIKTILVLTWALGTPLTSAFGSRRFGRTSTGSKRVQVGRCHKSSFQDRVRSGCHICPRDEGEGTRLAFQILKIPVLCK